jgi:C4-dicarboxylate-specific signal transduction histidine kinase
LGVLTRYVEQIREGRVEPIPAGYHRRVALEFGHLFDRFNAMARAFRERQTLAAHLAEQEKCAMLGRLASGMAHEVNNPLSGMLNAIDTIQAHGQIQRCGRRRLNSEARARGNSQCRACRLVT